MTEADINAIVNAFGIPEYIPAGSQIKAPVVPEEEEELLADSLRNAKEKVAEFFDSSAGILVIAGMEGTGREQIPKIAYKMAAKR